MVVEITFTVVFAIAIVAVVVVNHVAIVNDI